MNHRSFRIMIGLISVVILITVLVESRVRADGVIELTAGAYTEDFNTLISSGTSTSASFPPGWTFEEMGGVSNMYYSASAGETDESDTYSYGANGSPERALGGLGNMGLVPNFGVQFANETGQEIGYLTVTYWCEQWRLSATERVDRLDFEYSMDAFNLASGHWTSFDALDCHGSESTGTVGARDGNTVRTLVSATLDLHHTPIPNHATFWLRWKEYNVSGVDDGLAIDDFRLEKQTPSAIGMEGLSARNKALASGLTLAGFGSVCFALAWLLVYRRRTA